MNKIKWFGKKREKGTVAVWLNSDEAKEMICPQGYTPLIRNEEIRRCTHKIADLVSSMTIMLMENRENGDVRIRNELSKKIDIYPNKNMTRKNFIYKIVTDLILKGNSVVYPKIKNGLIDDLILWDMDDVDIQGGNDKYSIKYKGVKFDPDELLHFALIPDEREPYKGIGFSQQIKDTVSNLLQANVTKTAFLQSKWKPSMVISVNSDVEELQDENMRRKVLGSYTKTTEAGEPWLIPAGEIKVETIKPLTLQDLAIQDSITLDKKSIACAIGIPPFMVGVGDFNKDEYNNFISTTVMSIATVIQQTLTKGLLYDPHWYFKLNPKSLMQYALQEKVNFVKEMVGGGLLNRNEGRCEFDYAPVDDPGMNNYIVLENYVPVDRVGDQKKLKGGDPDETE